MGINRSGYYKWKSRQGKLNRYEQDRILLTQLLHAAVDEQAALDDLETFAQNWDNKYPKIAKSWRENWANLST